MILGSFGEPAGPKIGLASCGTLGPPKGLPKGAILVDLGVMLAHFGVISGAKLEPKSVLRHLVGPMAPPRAPLRAQGCHFGGFWGHFGDIFEVTIMPNSTPKFVAFSNVVCVGI